MTYKQAIKYFGGATKLAAALDMKSTQAVVNWKSTGIPKGRQYQIQVLTNGELKATPDSRGGV